MRRVVTCGFFLGVFFWAIFGASAQEEPALDLEPILVRKPDIHILPRSTLEAEDLREAGCDSLFEPLTRLMVDTQSRNLSGGTQADVSLRASTFQGVLMLVDGRRINDPQTAHHNSDLPLTIEDVERVEVIPGAGASVFGPDAIGGAINYLVKKPDQNRMVMQSSFGSHWGISELFSATKRFSRGGARLSCRRQESDGFSDDTDFKHLTLSSAWDLEVPGGSFFTTLGYQEKEFGAYDFYTPGQGYPSKEWTKTYLLNSGLLVEREGLAFKPNLLLRRHYDKFMLDKTGLRSNYLNHHRTDMFTPALYVRAETKYFGKAGCGLEYAREDIHSQSLGERERVNTSLAVDDRLDLFARLALSISSRVVLSGDSDAGPTGAANLQYKLGDRGSLHAGVSRSIRLPSFTELYYNDPTTSGEAGLSPEEALACQVGYAAAGDTLSGGCAFFYRQEKGMIDWVKHHPSEAKWKAENITRAGVFGIEPYIKAESGASASFSLRYAYNNKEVEGQGILYKYGHNYCRHLVNTCAEAKLPFGPQQLEFIYKKRPSRRGWLLVNTSFNWEAAKNLRFFLVVSNLLNVEYRDIEGIPQPGRSVEAGVRLEW